MYGKRGSDAESATVKDERGVLKDSLQARVFLPERVIVACDLEEVLVIDRLRRSVGVDVDVFGTRCGDRPGQEHWTRSFHGVQVISLPVELGRVVMTSSR